MQEGVLFSGIDAFTATSSVVSEDRLKARLFITELADYLQSEFFYTEPTKRFKTGQVSGWRKGSLTYGVSWNKQKAEFNMVSVTGKYAGKAADLAISYDGSLKITRMDFAVDVEFNKPIPGFASGIYSNLSRLTAEEDKKRYANLKIIKSQAGDTLYMASRESGRFGRLYDKSSAYGFDAGAGKVWRYEIELKKSFGQRAWASVKNSSRLEDTVIEASRAIWGGWSIPFSVSGSEFCKLERVSVSITTLEQRFDWLCRMSKSIRELIDNGYEARIREILNLPESDLLDTQKVEQLPLFP